jgi:methyl-accepting chemotaxis protein
MSLFALMRRFTIQLRMYVAILIVMVLLLCVGGAGLWGLLNNEREAENYQRASFTEVKLLGDMRHALGQVRLQERNMLLLIKDEDAMQRERNGWLHAVAMLRKGATAMLDGVEDEDNKVLRQLLEQLTAYEKSFDSKLSELKGVANNHEAIALVDEATAMAEQIDERLDEVDKIMRQESESARQTQLANVKTTMLLFAAAVCLALLIVVPTTILNQQAICRPLIEARSLAQAIAQGQLNNRADTKGQDEPADLLRALMQMQQSLSDMVSRVRVSANAITLASTEIAAGNMDLSSRTETAASSLQETANSMEHLTSTVQHSASSALQANALAMGAAEAARRGHDVVDSVVSSMDEIDHTSKRITDIIGVIDGIAFQTNILALNAAVEAARAGEQGRGFAVVAGEVRSLAQRSANAAREIKQLITTSSEKVAAGTGLAHSAGQAMQEIISSVERVSNMISEISSAASQQSTGITQVNQSVSSLDHMTQQNAALVEQAAASASSLKEQAQSLDQSVAVFQV